jgi:hypothetical protein
MFTRTRRMSMEWLLESEAERIFQDPSDSAPTAA